MKSSIGHDMNPRFEQAYTTIKIAPINTTWYIGRLPGMDGPPSRQAGSLFPRLFIDSEIDGTLIKWDIPKKSDVKVSGAPALASYERKLQKKSGIIIGYLKYDERGLRTPDDADTFLAQGRKRYHRHPQRTLYG